MLRNKKIRRTQFIVIFFFCCLVSNAQPEKDIQYYQNKYPGENAVEVLRRQTLEIKMKHNIPVIYYERYIEKILLTDMVSAFASEKIYFSSFDSVVEIKAFSLIPEGDKYKKAKVTEFAYSSDISNSIFYDDSKVCRFVYPSLTKGSRMVYSVKKEIKSPYFLPVMYLANLRAVEKSEIKYNYDNKVKLLFDKIGINESEIKTTEEKDGKRTIINLCMESIPPVNPEENVNSYRPYLPHIIPRIAFYEMGKNKDTCYILSSLGYLNKFYQGNVSLINKVDDTDIRLLADSITKGIVDEFDKVKSIYYWVQHNIRYIAFEDGTNGFIPMDAALVLSKRYADCKGMSNLMRVLLEKVGIKSYLTWVGTSEYPYKYTKIPSPAIDNHMVLCYFSPGGKPYILDATAEFQSIEYATSFIQGKECLVGIDSNTYKIIEIPYITSEITEISNLRLDTNILKLKASTYYEGNSKERYSYAYSHKTDEMKRKVFSEILADEGYPKSTIHKLAHSDLYAVDDTLVITCDYSLFDYTVQSNNTIYLKPFLRELASKHIDISKRKYNFELSEKQKYIWKQTIDIPNGYEVLFLPEDISFSHPLFSFKVNIQQTENGVLITATYHTDFIVLPKQDYSKWNEMNSLIRQFNVQSIVFKSKQ